MPRPPAPARSRGAPLRRAEPTPAQTTTAPPPVHSDSTDIYGVSDREVERQKTTQKGKDANISAPTEAPAATRSTRSRAPVSNAQNAKALEDSRKRRDAAMSRLEDITSTTAAGDEESSAAETGRKAAPATTRQSQRRVEASGMEIMDDEIFGNLDSTMRDEDDSTDRVTRSTDTSTFNVSVFKRRPRRQSSIVGRDDAPIRPSSRGPNTPGISSTFNLGHFKRRAREPSILMSSAQKERLQLPQPDSDADENAVEDDDDEKGEEEEADFLPDAEGTPARPSRGRISAAMERDGSPEPTTKARSRKRKSNESHETEAGKRQAVGPDNEIHESIEIDVGLSSPPSVLERSRNQTPEADDDILAPPASSSVEGSPTAWPSIKALGKTHTRRPVAKKTPEPNDDGLSEMSSPPSLTHSPNFPAPKPVAKSKAKGAPPKELPQVSTADLEALLPRRRNKTRRSDPDDPLAMEDSNDDEIRVAPARAARRKQSRPLGGASTASQAKAKGNAKETSSEKRARRTYGSRNFSDKENTVEGDSIEVAPDNVDAEDDTTFSADATPEKTAEQLGEELKQAAKKFKEVDKWELAFEECVESSSPIQEGR